MLDIHRLLGRGFLGDATYARVQLLGLDQLCFEFCVLVRQLGVLGL